MRATDEITEERIEAMVKFLTLANTVLKVESRISMTALKEPFKISYDIIENLKTNKILHNTGVGRGATWKWISKEPASREMAVRTLNEVVEEKKEKIAMSKKDREFEDIMKGKIPVTSETPVTTKVTIDKPKTAIETPKPVVAKSTDKGPVKKKAYGITKLFFGMLKIRTDYYE